MNSQFLQMRGGQECKGTVTKQQQFYFRFKIFATFSRLKFEATDQQQTDMTDLSRTRESHMEEAVLAFSCVASSTLLKV